LSGAINFARFREERMPIYEELTQQRQEVVAELRSAQADREGLLKDLEDARAATDECQREVAEVEADCAEIETEIAQQNKLQSAIRQESTNLKKKANELKDALATVDIELEEARAEERTWSAKVVASPARVRSEMDGLMASLEQEKADTAKSEREVQAVQRKVANVDRARAMVAEATAVLADIGSDRAKCEALAGDVRDAAAAVDALAARTADLRDQIQDSSQHIGRVEESVDHARRQGRTKLDAAQEELDRAREELLRVEKGRRDGMARVEAGEAEVRALEAEVERDGREAAAELAEMVEEFRGVEAVALQHDRALLQSIGAC